jgi:hypothetical protein
MLRREIQIVHSAVKSTVIKYCLKKMLLQDCNIIELFIFDSKMETWKRE